MGFAINTNNDALNTYRNLTNVQNSLSKSLEKLSSGLRINQAGDDAAGLSISTQLGSQVSGLTQASRNAQDGVSLVQTADGALGQAQTLLGRLRDLAVQAGNDSNSDAARAAIGTEATSITDELTRLSTSVNFNGTKLLNGSATNLTFQIGANGDSQSQIGVNLGSANLGAVATALGSQSVGSYAVTGGSIAAGDYSFTAGSTSVKVTIAAGSVPTSAEGLAASLNGNSGFANAFTATASSDGTKLLVTSKSGETISSATAPGAGVGAASVTSGAIQFDTAAHAKLAIAAIDTQIATISAARSDIGALENRFASAVSTISTSITNLTAAKSRITDVDMASEMVNYTRANVLSQSGTAMLAQANSLPQLALKLLS
jgi:flagellin